MNDAEKVRRRVVTPTLADHQTTIPLLENNIRTCECDVTEGKKPSFWKEAFIKHNKIKWHWAPLFFLIWIFLYCAIAIPAFNRLPKPLNINDEKKHPGRFIAERAEINLRKLVALGPRVVGSRANEIGAVKYFMDSIEKIRTELGSANEIEIDIQIASGSYVHWEMINMYQNIHNVVVKLSPKNSNSSSYLLVNSHYDSVPNGPGAGDDATMVGIMLETLRVLATSNVALRHPVVFLFNGAEENPLQGSHAFITQHKWAKNCKALINLDSAGNGGREILFQSGPKHPWLMKRYKLAIKHPFAATVAEEMFQHHFIPSDTDFRIFRDFGGVPGLDMAHQYNGYVYHTKYDTPELIPRGTLQNTGDNVLSLVHEIANAPELDDPSKFSEGHTIFFDVLGIFFVFYTETEGIILNVLVSLAVIVTCIYSFIKTAQNAEINLRETFKEIGRLYVVQCVAVLVAIGFCFLFGALMDVLNLTMSWFTKSWLIIGLYFCSFYFGLAIIPAIYFHFKNSNKFSLGQRVQFLLHCHCLNLAILTLVLTICSIRSAYILMIAILFYLMALIINIATNLHTKEHAWIITHIICNVPPFILYAYLGHILFVTFIPMTGRFGPHVNPDLVISAFSVGMALLTFGFMIPILNLFKKSKTIICALLGITLICIIFAATPWGFPFREETNVQRISVLHTKRTFRDEFQRIRRVESGYFVLPQDKRTYSIKGVTNSTRAINLKHDCETEMLCGLPLYNHRWHKARMDNLWIPAPEPKFDRLPLIQLISKQFLSPIKVRLELELTGPDHMGLFFQPINGGKIVNWSFNSKPLDMNWSPPYYVYFSYGIGEPSLKFWIEVQKLPESSKSGDIEIGLTSHWNHHEELLTNGFKEFLESFPKYADIVAWPASYETWIF